jgi:succinate dehydrogenase / fumarate reductase cytochrome b subunit
MSFFKSMVGRKAVMAVSGLLMVVFVVGHLLGNSTIYGGPGGINAYAEKLHALFPVVWGYRVVMMVLVSLHIFFGIQLSLENSAAKPQGYAIDRSLSATFGSRSMIWTGLIILGFLIYHLLHFTFQVTNPELSAVRHLDTVGRPDVFHMVVGSFQKALISLIYAGALTALAFHLSHGIQSIFQSLGLNNDRTLPVVVKTGKAAAVVLYAGYLAIPFIILIGILKG